MNLAVALVLTRKGGGGQARTKALNNIFAFQGASFVPSVEDIKRVQKRFKRRRRLHLHVMANQPRRATQEISWETYWRRMDLHYRVRNLWKFSSEMKLEGSMYDFSPDVYDARKLIIKEKSIIKFHKKVLAKLYELARSSAIRQRTDEAIDWQARSDALRTEEEKETQRINNRWLAFRAFKRRVTGTLNWQRDMRCWKLAPRITEDWVELSSARMFWDYQRIQMKVMSLSRRANHGAPNSLIESLCITNYIIYTNIFYNKTMPLNWWDQDWVYYW